MAKENPNTKAKGETPFQRFERLVARIVRVPKEKVQERGHKRPA